MRAACTCLRYRVRKTNKTPRVPAARTHALGTPHALPTSPLSHTHQHPGFDFSGAAFSGSAPDPRTFLKEDE